MIKKTCKIIGNFLVPLIPGAIMHAQYKFEDKDTKAFEAYFKKQGSVKRKTSTLLDKVFPTLTIGLIKEGLTAFMVYKGVEAMINGNYHGGIAVTLTGLGFREFLYHYEEHYKKLVQKEISEIN